MAEYKGKYKSVYNPEIEFESDYIAREAARDLMYHNQYPLTEYDLNDLPPADVRPVVRGQWKPFDLTFGRSIYECSSCGESSKVPTVLGKLRYRYCPHCGADMREEEMSE